VSGASSAFPAAPAGGSGAPLAKLHPSAFAAGSDDEDAHSPPRLLSPLEAVARGAEGGGGDGGADARAPRAARRAPPPHPADVAAAVFLSRVVEARELESTLVAIAARMARNDATGIAFDWDAHLPPIRAAVADATSHLPGLGGDRPPSPSALFRAGPRGGAGSALDESPKFLRSPSAAHPGGGEGGGGGRGGGEGGAGAGGAGDEGGGGATLSPFPELVRLMPILLRFAYVRSTRLPSGNRLFGSLLASPLGLAIAHGVFWLVHTRLIAEREEARRAVRAERAAHLGLTLRELQEVEAAGAPLDGSPAKGEGAAAAAAAGEEGGAGGAGGAASARSAAEEEDEATRAVRRRRRREEEADEAVAALKAAMTPSERTLAAQEALVDALSSAYATLLKRLSAAAPANARRAGHLASSPAPRGNARADPTVSVTAALPLVVADAVFHAFVVGLGGTRSLYTARFKLEIFLIVARLLTGIDVAPGALLDAQETRFAPLLLLPLDFPPPGTPRGVSAFPAAALP
jgi:hypothetical protein